MEPIQIPLRENAAPSICGTTVLRKQVINIQNAYRDARFDPTWDKRTGYHTRSILCVPIIDTASGKDACIGCLQVINKKDRYERSEGQSFNENDERLAHNFCSVVAIAVQHAESTKTAEGAVDLAMKIVGDGD